MSNSINQNLLAPQYFEFFKKAGITIKGFYPYDLLDKKIKGRFSKGLFKLFPDSFYKTCNENLLTLVEEFKPTILFLFKGMSIWPETLEKIKAKGIKLVNYNPDHPFSTGNYQSNSNSKNSIPLFDLYLSFSQQAIQQLNLEYPNLKTEWLPFGHNISEDLYRKIKTTPEILAACFVGTADMERKTFLAQIGKANIPLHVFGNGWDSVNFKNQTVKIHSEITGLAYHKVLQSYRIQLNLFRPQNHNSHNMRSFEIPAIGGIMLAPKSVEHDLFYKENTHYLSYKNTEEVIQKSKQILELKKEKADEIRTNARQKTVASNYHYSYRAQQLLTLLKKL